MDNKVLKVGDYVLITDNSKTNLWNIWRKMAWEQWLKMKEHTLNMLLK